MSIGQKSIDGDPDPIILNRVNEPRATALTSPGNTTRFDPIRIARWVSLVLHPFLVSPLAIVLVLYLDSGAFWPAIGWALLCAAFVIGPALLYLQRKLKQKRYTDADVSVREQRHSFYLFGGLCMVICLAVLLWLGAPQLLMSAFIAALSAIVISAVITRFWLKVSIHTGVMAGVTTIMAFYSIPLLLLFTFGTLLIVWSRLILKRHTPSEAILGGVVGASCVLIVFIPIILR